MNEIDQEKLERGTTTFEEWLQICDGHNKHPLNHILFAHLNICKWQITLIIFISIILFLWFFKNRPFSMNHLYN